MINLLEEMNKKQLESLKEQQQQNVNISVEDRSKRLSLIDIFIRRAK